MASKQTATKGREMDAYSAATNDRELTDSMGAAIDAQLAARRAATTTPDDDCATVAAKIATDAAWDSLRTDTPDTPEIAAQRLRAAIRSGCERDDWTTQEDGTRVGTWTL